MCACRKTPESRAAACATGFVAGTATAPGMMGQPNYGAVAAPYQPATPVPYYGAAPHPAQAPHPPAGGAQYIVPTVVQQDGAVSFQNPHGMQTVPAAGNACVVQGAYVVHGPGTGPAGVQLMQ